MLTLEEIAKLKLGDIAYDETYKNYAIILKIGETDTFGKFFESLNLNTNQIEELYIDGRDRLIIC